MVGRRDRGVVEQINWHRIFSDREIILLTAAAYGVSDPALVIITGDTSRAIRNLWDRLKKKMGARTRAEAVALACKWNIL